METIPTLPQEENPTLENRESETKLKDKALYLREVLDQYSETTLLEFMKFGNALDFSFDEYHTPEGKQERLNNLEEKRVDLIGSLSAFKKTLEIQAANPDKSIISNVLNDLIGNTEELIDDLKNRKQEANRLMVLIIANFRGKFDGIRMTVNSFLHD